MFSIAICPKCGQQVSIPSGVDRDAVVRCPLCAAEFPLCRALEFAMAGPPAVALVAPSPEPKPEQITNIEPAVVTMPVVAASTIEPAAAGESSGAAAEAVVTADTAAEAAAPSDLMAGEVAIAAETAPTETVDVQPMEMLTPLPVSEGSPAAIETVMVGAVGQQPSDKPQDQAAKQAEEEAAGGIYSIAGEKKQPAAAPVTDSRFDAIDNPYVDIFDDSPRPASAASPSAGGTATLEEAHAAEAPAEDYGHVAPDAAAVTGTPAARGWQPRGKQKNPLRMIVGVIVSGVLGILMAMLLFAAVRGCSSGSRKPSPPQNKQTGPAKAPNLTPDDTEKKRWEGLKTKI